jgi:predicted nicotinamide N-methyase
LALAALPLVSGCGVVAAGAAGAGAVAYVRGEMQSSVEHDLDTTYQATQRALKDLQFARIDDQKSGVDAQLISRTALDKKVEIKLKKVTDGLTKVQIRVGVVGDQELSLTILEKIKAELK